MRPPTPTTIPRPTSWSPTSPTSAPARSTGSTPSAIALTSAGSARGRVAEPSYMHSFAMTERYLVLVAFPLVVNPLSLALSGRPFIENYKWKPELGTRVLVFDRGTGELKADCEAEPRFAFHHVNAFERGSELVLDMAAYDDATIIDSLYLDRIRMESPSESATARLLRYRVSLDTASVVEEELATRGWSCPRSTTASATAARTGTCTGSPPTATVTPPTSSTS